MFRKAGFTLLEILIALFIFSILSLIIVNALHNVLTTQSSVEKNADKLAQLQVAMTLIARDFEQTIDRSIVNSSGTVEPSFIGTPQSATFTHMGLANPLDTGPRSTLQRTRYRFEGGALIRDTWTALDQTNQTKLLSRNLLQNVISVSFEFLDPTLKFSTRWPSSNQGRDTSELPIAVRITITLNDFGKIGQLYVIPQQKIKQN